MSSDDEFYSENIEVINRICSSIILFSNLLGPAFLILTYIGIFKIPVLYSVVVICLIAPVSVLHLLCVYKFKFQKFAMYLGLVGMSMIVGLMGSQFHIGIYIGYSLVLFMSCLYYNMRLTVFIAVFDYIVMMVSLYFKGVSGFAEGNPYVGSSPWYYFSRMGLGFTMEYVFAFIIAVNIVKRCEIAFSLSEQKNIDLIKIQFEIMDFIPKVLESHELFTGHHVAHTVTYVDMIAKELRREGHYTDILDIETIWLYSKAANLHDIGKVHIPDNILNKPGKFTPEEFAMMKTHPEEGKKLIEYLPNIENGEFNKIASQMAYYHHEKFDGTGYPNGIAGTDIPLCARIMTAADVLDALLSWRPYKERMDIEQVMKIFENGKGTHFEPCIADAVLSLKSEIYEVSQEFLEKEIGDEEKEYSWRQQLKNSQDEFENGNA